MRHYPELASYNNCTGCMACIDACNHDVLKLAVDDDGYYKIDINSDKCIGCNLCSMSCPIISPIELPNNEMTKIFASWSMDSDLRQQSASGGIFASLASLILNRGGVVYGAAIDKFENVVTKGGLALVNSSMTGERLLRDDIEYIMEPLSDLAARSKEKMLLNIMALGLLIRKTGILTKESVIKALEKVSSAKKPEFLKFNIESFEAGYNLVKAVQSKTLEKIGCQLK